MDAAGGEQDADVGAILAQPMREADAVHVARHLDVREHEIDGLAGFEHGDRGAGAVGFEDGPATLAQEFAGVQPDDVLVLHDQDRRCARLPQTHINIPLRLARHPAAAQLNLTTEDATIIVAL